MAEKFPSPEEFPSPSTHPLGPRGIAQQPPSNRDPRIPLQEAVDRVAEQTGYPREVVEELAKKLLAGQPKPAIRPELLQQMVSATSGAAHAARHLAIELDVAHLDARSMIKRLNQVKHEASQCPKNPADRRTTHLLGKPYHYVQDAEGQLHTEPGESPWI